MRSNLKKFENHPSCLAYPISPNKKSTKKNDFALHSKKCSAHKHHPTKRTEELNKNEMDVLVFFYMQMTVDPF